MSKANTSRPGRANVEGRAVSDDNTPTATADPSPATVMRIEALLRGHWPRPVPADAPDTLIGASPHPRGRPKTSPPRMVPHAPSFESGDPVGSLVSPGTCQSSERDVAPAAARREAG